MKKVVVLTALALGVALAGPARADLKTGLDAYYSQDYTAALNEIRPLAEAGDPMAQYRLGVMFDYGQGVTPDTAEAARWLRLAARQGNADAQFALGLMYELGRGVKWSHGEAFVWIRRAAHQGHYSALHWLENQRGGEGRDCPAC